MDLDTAKALGSFLGAADRLLAQLGEGTRENTVRRLVEEARRAGIALGKAQCGALIREDTSNEKKITPALEQRLLAVLTTDGWHQTLGALADRLNVSAEDVAKILDRLKRQSDRPT